jgi:hypothetical protein
MGLLPLLMSRRQKPTTMNAGLKHRSVLKVTTTFAGQAKRQKACVGADKITLVLILHKQTKKIDKVSNNLNSPIGKSDLYLQSGRAGRHLKFYRSSIHGLTHSQLCTCARLRIANEPQNHCSVNNASFDFTTQHAVTRVYCTQ